MREIRWIPVITAGLWGGVLLALIVGLYGCAPAVQADKSADCITDAECAEFGGYGDPK